MRTGASAPPLPSGASTGTGRSTPPTATGRASAPDAGRGRVSCRSTRARSIPLPCSSGWSRSSRPRAPQAPERADVPAAPRCPGSASRSSPGEPLPPDGRRWRAVRAADACRPWTARRRARDHLRPATGAAVRRQGLASPRLRRGARTGRRRPAAPPPVSAFDCASDDDCGAARRERGVGRGERARRGRGSASSRPRRRPGPSRAPTPAGGRRRRRGRARGARRRAVPDARRRPPRRRVAARRRSRSSWSGLRRASAGPKFTRGCELLPPELGAPRRA